MPDIFKSDGRRRLYEVGRGNHEEARPDVQQTAWGPVLVGPPTTDAVGQAKAADGHWVPALLVCSDSPMREEAVRFFLQAPPGGWDECREIVGLGKDRQGDFGSAYVGFVRDVVAYATLPMTRSFDFDDRVHWKAGRQQSSVSCQLTAPRRALRVLQARLGLWTLVVRPDAKNSIRFDGGKPAGRGVAGAWPPLTRPGPLVEAGFDLVLAGASSDLFDSVLAGPAAGRPDGIEVHLVV